MKSPLRIGAGLGVLFAAAIALAASDKERVEVSAPLLPHYLGASTRIEGPANYPTDLQTKIAYVKANTWTFEELLVKCAPDYSGIVLQAPGGPQPTKAELARNYDLVAQCSYEKYSAKPYWIPQLVDDVDVCAVKLGASWRMITEQDLQTLDPADYQFVADTLSGVGGGWGSFYFSLHTYVRAADGTLKMGDLTPGAAQRVLPLPVNTAGWNDDPRWPLEGDLVPRCIRRTPVVAAP